MVDIPDLGEGFHAMWQELLHLAENAPAPWTLIGAHMVALHGWRMGRKQPRASRDADILVNVRVVSRGTERVSETLLSRGFSLDGVSPEGVGHRFISGQVRFDVLGPDGVGARTGLFTVSGARTVEVPGGSQALQRTEMVEVRVGRISNSERRWLRRHPEFSDSGRPSYRGIPHAEDAATVFRRLSRAG